jgi:transcriptional regulator with XRE-family HTH domain
VVPFPMNTRNPKTHLAVLIDSGLVATGNSLRNLARLCGVDPTYIVQLRQGKIRHPREDLLACIAETLGQDVADYRLALLADHGDVPGWSRVLETELGVRLSTEDEQAIMAVVEALIKHRRGS